MKNSFTIAVLALALPFLLLTVPFLSLPSVEAHTPLQSWPTTACIRVYPYVVGVNQHVNISISLDRAPPTATASGGDRWQGLEITITKPDGTQERLGPFLSDKNGGARVMYTPLMVGVYTFVLRYPGQVLRLQNPAFNNLPGVYSDYVNDTFLPSTSLPGTLRVQQEPISSLPPTPAPSVSVMPTSSTTTQPTPQMVSTTTHVGVYPNPIGVGQLTRIDFGVEPPPPPGTLRGGDRWQGITVAIGKPDGTRETLGPFLSNSSGGGFAFYTPTQLGTYTLQASFPGQTVEFTYSDYRAGDQFSPSNSNHVTLTVQQQSVGTPSSSPNPQSTTPQSTPRPVPQITTMPSTPEFNLQFVPSPYRMVTTDPYTGANSSYAVNCSAVEVIIKNRPFNAYYDAASHSDIALYYNVRVKGHFGYNWQELFSFGDYPDKSNSEYTVIPYLQNHSPGSQIDFQVQAIIGSTTEVFVPSSGSTSNPGSYQYIFAVQASSGWSSTETITIPEPSEPSASELPSPSPSPTPSATSTVYTEPSSWSQAPTLTKSPIPVPPQQSYSAAKIGAPPTLGEVFAIAILVFVGATVGAYLISRRLR